MSKRSFIFVDVPGQYYDEPIDKKTIEICRRDNKMKDMLIELLADYDDRTQCSYERCTCFEDAPHTCSFCETRDLVQRATEVLKTPEAPIQSEVPHGYTVPITTHADVERLLTLLHKQGKSYHCEDDANWIEYVQFGNLDGQRTFTADEAMHLNQRMWEAYQLDWDGHPDGCPCGMVIRIGDIGGEVPSA